MSASPIPEHEVVHSNLGRGLRWYLLVDGLVRGGPCQTREDAEAAMEHRLSEIHAEYEAFNGPGVAW